MHCLEGIIPYCFDSCMASTCYLWELYDLTVKPYLTQKREIRLNEENGERF